MPFWIKNKEIIMIIAFGMVKDRARKIIPAQRISKILAMSAEIKNIEPLINK